MTTSGRSSPPSPSAREREAPTTGDAWQALIFDVGQGGGAARQARLRGDLPRVPRPYERAARRLAAGQPGPGVRRRACPGGLGLDRGRGSPARCRWEAEDERRPAAAPRGTGRHPPGRDRQGRGPGARRPCARARRASGGACSARARRSRPSATPPRSGSARRSRAAPKPDGPEVAELKAASVAAGERITALDASLAEIEAELDDLLLRIPNPADPDVPVGGEEANVTIRTWGELLAHDEPLEGEVGADAAGRWRRPGRASRTGSSARRSTSSTTPAARRSPAPGSRSTRAPVRRSSAGLINWFLDVHTRENGFTEVWPPAVVNTASATRHRPDPGQGRPDVRRHPRRAVPGPHGRGPRHEPAPRRDPRGGASCRSTTRPTRRASAARPARPARTPAGSCASTSSTRSRWCCSRSPTTRPQRWSG